VITHFLAKKAIPIEDELFSSFMRVTVGVREAFVANFLNPDRVHYVFHLVIFTLFMISPGMTSSPRGNVMLTFFCAAVDALCAFTENGEQGQ
jgi:hypothetical protein